MLQSIHKIIFSLNAQVNVSVVAFVSFYKTEEISQPGLAHCFCNVTGVLKGLHQFLNPVLRSLLRIENVPTSQHYVDGISVLVEVLVILVVEVNAVRVKLDNVPLVKALLDVGDTPDGHHDVGSEHDQDQGLDPLEVEGVAQLVPEEDHAGVVLVVEGVVGVGGVDPASEEEPVDQASVE